MSGTVISVDAPSKIAVVNAGKIEGWMEAMTMDYPVPDPADFQKLFPGARITGTVEVRDLNYSLRDIRVAK